MNGSVRTYVHTRVTTTMVIVHKPRNYPYTRVEMLPPRPAPALNLCLLESLCFLCQKGSGETSEKGVAPLPGTERKRSIVSRVKFCTLIHFPFDPKFSKCFCFDFYIIFCFYILLCLVTIFWFLSYPFLEQMFIGQVLLDSSPAAIRQK